MDFRFKYRRGRQSPAEAAREERQESDIAVRGRGMALAMSIPMTLLSGPLAGWLGGHYLDKAMGTSFWLPTLVVLGIFGSLALVVRQLTVLGNK